MQVKEVFDYINNLKLNKHEAEISKRILIELKNRLTYLIDVGLGYLTLNRASNSLSGGESQRMKIARELSENSDGNSVYILDEPTTGLHVDDVSTLITVLRELMDNDNTVIEEVHYLPIEEASTELKRYRAGELDITGAIPANQLDWIRKNLPGELHIAPTLGTYYYGFNLTRPPFKDNLKLRQALSMAVDREILTEKISKAGEIPAYGWVPPGVSNYTSQALDYAKMTKAERIKKAKQLYQEAGYNQGNPLTVEIRYNTSEGHKKMAIAIAAMWKKNLGIRARLINEEWKVFLENRKQKKLTEAFRGGWIGDYNDAFTFAELMQSDHGINDSGYNNPEYDKLLEQAAHESDLDKRRLIMEEAERMLLKDHAIMPLYFYVTKHLIKPYVKGYQPNILDHTYTKNLWIEKH